MLAQFLSFGAQLALLRHNSASTPRARVDLVVVVLEQARLPRSRDFLLTICGHDGALTLAEPQTGHSPACAFLGS